MQEHYTRVHDCSAFLVSRGRRPRDELRRTIGLIEKWHVYQGKLATSIKSPIADDIHIGTRAIWMLSVTVTVH